jgi:hypothetical protein
MKDSVCMEATGNEARREASKGKLIVEDYTG